MTSLLTLLMPIVRERNHPRSTSYARKRFYSMSHASKEDIAERNGPNDSLMITLGRTRSCRGHLIESSYCKLHHGSGPPSSSELKGRKAQPQIEGSPSCSARWRATYYIDIPGLKRTKRQPFPHSNTRFSFIRVTSADRDRLDVIEASSECGPEALVS